MYIFICEVNHSVLHLLRINVYDLHANLTASQLLTQNSSLLQCIDCSVWINATLKAEACISAQSMTTSALADPCWMEVGTLKHNVLCCLVSTATLTAKHTSDTHWVLLVADSQIAIAQLVLLAIQSLEWSSVRHSLNHNLVALHHVGIECVQRLSVSHHHVVSDVYYVVDRTQADSVQLILKPLRTLLNLTVGYAYASITLTSLSILNLHLDRQVVIVYCKCRAVRAMHLGLVAIALEPCIQVACHTPVTQSVSTVSGDVNLDKPVALQIVVLSSRSSYYCILRQNNDTIVTCAHANLVFSADHTVTLYTAELRLLDYKLLITIVEHTAQISNNNLLTCSNVRSTTNNL